ncbi:hypothetical protein RR48_06595 [Papilio machaon]|uniref:Uncharacterized protein n=1 Tax=Papilio machaon TaxID=76193 RepID=A0A194RK31_PAPMA|nr:hypothetical protein RR48_06595 [Papilio machaon]
MPSTAPRTAQNGEPHFARWSRGEVATLRSEETMRREREREKNINRGVMLLDDCDSVCEDLPAVDKEPVCMMFSRYKRGYQFFINECHARRSICKENLVLQMVHPSRCFKSNQFFMPMN